MDGRDERLSSHHITGWRTTTTNQFSLLLTNSIYTWLYLLASYFPFRWRMLRGVSFLISLLPSLVSPNRQAFTRAIPSIQRPLMSWWMLNSVKFRLSAFIRRIQMHKIFISRSKRLSDENIFRNINVYMYILFPSTRNDFYLVVVKKTYITVSQWSEAVRWAGNTQLERPNERIEMKYYYSVFFWDRNSHCSSGWQRWGDFEGFHR